MTLPVMAGFKISKSGSNRLLAGSRGPQLDLLATTFLESFSSAPFDIELALLFLLFFFDFVRVDARPLADTAAFTAAASSLQ